jgi:hypothetical protein
VKKASNLWHKILERDESHPDISVQKPDRDLGHTLTPLLIGGPLLLLIVLIYWLLGGR